jgi:hypothetical protein
MSTTDGAHQPAAGVDAINCVLSRNGQEENRHRQEDHRETDWNPQQSEI